MLENADAFSSTRAVISDELPFQAAKILLTNIHQRFRFNTVLFNHPNFLLKYTKKECFISVQIALQLMKSQQPIASFS